MKRSEMVAYLQKLLSTFEGCKLDRLAADEILEGLEHLGMTPPRTSEENVQAILSIYYAGYTTHQWDEDLEKDEKVTEAKRKRAESAALTPEERSARLRAFARQRTGK